MFPQENLARKGLTCLSISDIDMKIYEWVSDTLYVTKGKDSVPKSIHVLLAFSLIFSIFHMK